jgi:hypothetical protein
MDYILCILKFKRYSVNSTPVMKIIIFDAGLTYIKKVTLLIGIIIFRPTAIRGMDIFV